KAARQVQDCSEPSSLLAAIDCLCNSAEADERVATRHVRGLSGCDQLVGVQCHEALNLVGDLFVALRPERKQQAVEPAPDDPHHFSSCGATNLARIAVVW